jgi:EAL domain-containing protein (putative c-di-GMP-specific phosphodiesterase class I)
LEKLGSLGIEFAQGYYIAKPASVETFQPCAERTAQLLA